MIVASLRVYLEPPWLVHFAFREDHVIVACNLLLIAGVDRCVEVVAVIVAVYACISGHGRVPAAAVATILMV
jgi:hypothetical protein